MPENLVIPADADNSTHQINKSNMRYNQQTPTRTESSIDFYSNGVCIETLRPKKDIGKGGHGSTRLFANRDGSKNVVVKRMLDGADYADKPVTQEQVTEYMARINNEIDHLALAYPHREPYAVKHFIANGEYDCRVIEPNFGISVPDFFDAQITTATSFAILAWKIGEEITRLHKQLGFFHGDIRPGNILWDTKDINSKFGLTSVIKLIDMDYANKLGEGMTIIEANEATHELHFLTIDEITDRLDFKSMLKQLLEDFTAKHPIETRKLERQFPKLMSFIKDNISEDDISKRFLSVIASLKEKTSLIQPVKRTRTISDWIFPLLYIKSYTAGEGETSVANHAPKYAKRPK